jgi:CheY-like chemotaxis protein
MLTAIHIGNDPVLPGTRAALLQSIGIRVVNVARSSDAMGAILATSFDVAVLCHSLDRSDRLKLARTIRQRNPLALILLVSGGLGVCTGEKDGMDAVLDSDPQRLLQAIRQMLDMSEEGRSSVRPAKCGNRRVCQA